MQLTIGEVLTYFQSAKVRDFCARVIAALQRIAAPGLGTMGVGIGPDGRLRLYYDPEFVSANDLGKLQLIIQHELIHIVDDHIPRYLNLISGLTNDEEKKRFKSVMNIAADLAGNETIRTEKDFDTSAPAKQWFFRSEKNPHSFLIPEDFKFPRKLPFEAYQMLLLKQRQQIEQQIMQLELPGQGSGQDQQPGEGQGQSALDKYFQERAGGNAHKYWEADLKDKNAEELQVFMLTR